MLDYNSNSVLSALKKYERESEGSGKKALLLTPQGGYFLYGNRFCSIQGFELELVCDSCVIQGKSVQSPIFLGILQDGFFAVGEQVHDPKLISVIFHVDLEEDEPLRGILLVLGREVRFSLFSDAAFEDLYRLSRKTYQHPIWSVPPDEELKQQAEQLRRNDLHSLTGLYLQGHSLKELLAAESFRG